jgi:hypothetical protein
MDSRIALLYHKDLPKVRRKENNEIDWEEFHERLKDIIKKYNENIGRPENDPYSLKTGRHEYTDEKTGKKNYRPYMYYRCIYSELLEYAFPVIYAGKIVAVLMHGQYPPEGLKPEDMFKNYRDDELLSASIEELQKKGFFICPEDYEEVRKQRFDDILARIRMLEDRIQNAVEAKSREYVSTQFFKIEEEFRKEINNDTTDDIDNLGDKFVNLHKKNENLDKKLKDYKTVLDKTLKNLFEQFNSNDKKGFIRIYAIESPIATVNSKRDAFTIIGDSSFNRDDDSGYFKLIFRKIKKTNKTMEKEELLDYFLERYRPKEFDKDGDIFRMEVRFASSYVIWEKYSNFDKDQYKKYIFPYLKMIYHTLLEPYLILKGMKLEK